MVTFTLAHISDPHLGPLPQVKKRQLLSKRVLGYANWKRHRGKGLTNKPLDDLIADLKTQNYDHLAVTGDLVNIALPLEIENASIWLKTLGAPTDVSVVPGNHDAYVPGALRRAYQAWRAFMSDDKSNKHAPSDKPEFPYLRVRGNVALIGLSTAVASNAFMATGKLGKNQLQTLAALLKSCKEQNLFRVVMIHHPPLDHAKFWHKRLIDRSKFRKVIAEYGAELIIHGHTHKVSNQHIEGPSSANVPVIGVPSASAGNDGRYEEGRYNLFHISNQQGSWKCVHHQRGRDDQGRFAILTEQKLI